MQKAVAYISSIKKNNIEREIELKVQSERIRDFCKKNELEFFEIYEEPKESTEDYKVELFRLLDNATKGDFSHVIVLALDRISYDTVVKVWVTDELKKNGIRLLSLTENMTLSPDTDEKIKEKAEKIKEKVRDIPSLPEIVNKVISLVQNPNSSAAQIAAIIANDAGLTARVLRLVNSAYYGFPKQISSIQHAIAILGFTTIRGLILSSSIFRIFAPKDNAVKLLDYKKMWRHSLLSAIIGKHINKILQIFDSENLFSASILHDMGKIILDQYDHGNYIMALSENHGFDLIKNLANEKKYCGLDHCEAGHLIAEHWNLPEPIAEAIRYHHEPQSAIAEYRNMVGVVAISNIFAHVHEKDIELAPQLFKGIDLEVIGLDVAKIFDIYAFVEQELQNENGLDEFFE